MSAKPSSIRVLSIPAGHVYVRHIAPVGADDGVARLEDPKVPAEVPAAQWWPPPALNPRWVRRHHEEFDLAHVHFGFDARDPADLATWVAELRAWGKPLVYTVHDLRNPHHVDSGLHDDQLDVLIPAADGLVTLTRGAARVVEQRWGRRCEVLPHPHVAPVELVGRPRPSRREFVVGVHLKSLRVSMDPVPVVEVLAHVVPELEHARLRIDVHTDVMTPGSPQHDPEVRSLLMSLEDRDGIEVVVHDFFSDDELWEYFRSIDVSVLPYRFGTHSGWLEACHDLGTTVLASDCGFYAEQRPCVSFHLGPDGLDRDGLAAAVRSAHQLRPRWQADRGGRLAERGAVARAHRGIYEEVLAR